MVRILDGALLWICRNDSRQNLKDVEVNSTKEAIAASRGRWLESNTVKNPKCIGWCPTVHDWRKVTATKSPNLE